MKFQNSRELSVDELKLCVYCTECSLCSIQTTIKSLKIGRCQEFSHFHDGKLWELKTYTERLFHILITLFFASITRYVETRKSFMLIGSTICDIFIEYFKNNGIEV